VKVRNGFSNARTAIGALLVAAFAAAVIFAAPAPAHAITRDTVMQRARVWVKKKVPYSQRRYYKGYRRDCSGFVSMAWKLRRSYTTRTIGSRAKRIPLGALKPGDAVLTRGHASLFGGWKSKKARTYWAYEQTTWGSHAKKRVRRIPRGAKALRYKKISPTPRKVVTTPPVASPPAAASVPADTTSSLDVSPVLRRWIASPATGVRFVV
jgi:hypothetical protein